MKYSTNKLHPSHLGKFFEIKYGVEALAKDFNQYRRLLGMPPVKTETVRRYNGGKSGYVYTVPSCYKHFLISRIS